MTGANPTIFALSSGAGRAGVAVIRLSGDRTRFALDMMTGQTPDPRVASLRSIRDQYGQVIDRGLVLWFPGPGSFTGEDSAELQLHGSVAVINDVMEALASLPGFRLAEPGEFARRAFENGKLDLTAVEGLADLIDAETTAQRRAALRQADGGLQRLYEGWRRELLRVMALVEAGIDFTEEGDIAETVMAESAPLIQSIRQQIEEHLSQSRRARGLRRGIIVCLAGPPNVGKSSLMNWLAERDVAIVDALAGTTRDRLEARIVLSGVPVTVMDTAGLRSDPSSPVEAQGIARTHDALKSADIIIWMNAVGCPQHMVSNDPVLVDSDTEQIKVMNKADLLDDNTETAIDSDAIKISVRSGAALDDLLAHLNQAICRFAGLTEHPTASRHRHVELLSACLVALEEADRPASYLQPELMAESLRAAANALGRVTGRIDVEDVLGAIFSEFCIGK
jgi:tRNA modification GTPase